VFISPLGPVTVNVTTAILADLSIEGMLDVSTYTIPGTGTFYLSETGTLFVGGADNFPAGFATYYINSNSYVHYNAAGNQSITDIAYGNLILSNSGIKSFPATSMSINGNFTLSGSATTTLSRNLTVSGTTTLAGSSVLTIGAPEVLSNTGTIVLDGGTLRTGAATGYSETLGLLIVPNTATIALGTGTHSLTFAPSSGLIWSGASLTITGWTGTPGSTGTAGKIFFGTAAGNLSSAQLAKIIFAGFPGTTSTLLSTGELVPIASPNLAVSGSTSHGGSCIGVAALPVTYTITNTGSNATGVTVTSNNTQFVVSAAPTTVAGNGGTSTYVVTFTPNGSGPQTATITVACTTPGSNSPVSSLTGTGNTIPTAGLTSSDPDNTICAGDAITFTATGGTSYEFFVGATSQGAASATATFTTSILTTGQIVTVKVTNANTCVATSTGITTTVNALPVAPVITGTPSATVGSITMLGSATGGGVWSSGTPANATVDASTGVVTGIAAGISQIRYTVTNANGCSNFGTILVTVSAVTGIEELQSKDVLALRNHPNPFIGNTIISYTLPSDGRVTLTIRSLTGQVMKTLINEMELEGEHTLNIEVSDLQSGVYFATLSLKNNGKELIKTIRIVKGN
jgi:hypothetical protein